MLFVRVSPKKSLAAVFTSVDDILVDQIVTAKATFGRELQ